MTSKYEFWLTDDAGRRITLLSNFAFASYSRTVQGYGTIQFGIPYDYYVEKVSKNFQPDWRLDVWRSPGSGYDLRRESSYLLRKFSVYQRTTDNVRILEMIGRSPLDILRRASVVTNTVAKYTKTDQIDDMMKEIVTDNFITIAGAPVGEFSVDANVGLGPTITLSFFGRVVLDVLKELKATSFTLNRINGSKKIYFDVVEGSAVGSGFGYTFKTYAERRGTDRRTGTHYSIENGNIMAPAYIEDYLDESTEAVVYNQTTSSGVTVDSPDARMSRWNRIQQYESSSGTSLNDMTSRANRMLDESGAAVNLSATFIDSPGGENQPRSLYGVD